MLRRTAQASSFITCNFLRCHTVNYSTSVQRGVPDNQNKQENNENTNIDTRASARLWSDAQVEEVTGSSTIHHKLKSISYRDKAAEIAQSHPNWTGDESPQDAVLRMLVDKYKPLRGHVKTADEKIKDNKIGLGPIPTTALPPSTLTQTSTSPPPPPPLTPEHKPWLTTFKAPSHASSSIRYMRLPPPSQPLKRTSPRALNHPADEDDARTRIIERERKRKEAFVGRITGAKERSLDYRLGIAEGAATVNARRPARGGGPPNPVSMKGWAGLVEERIERARSEGHFSNLKGHGKPLKRDLQQSNPFIPREEFLMNRIVRRQGAVPPWVEYQLELDTALSTFRTALYENWTRRAIRHFTTQHPPSLLHTVSTDSIRAFRDPTWESREQSYHDRTVAEINKLVRRYNGVAPYPVRRVELVREREMQKMYEACWEQVLDGVRNRANGSETGVKGVVVDDSGECGKMSSDINRSGFNNIGFDFFGLRAMWQKWVNRLVGGKLQ